MGDGLDGTGAPSLDFFVELFGGLADLGGGDFKTAEFFHDFGNFAGGDALEIHFGDGGGEGLLTALTTLEGGGKEGLGAVAHLRDGDFDGADASVESAVFKTVGVAVSVFGALVCGRPDMALSFDKHGLVNKSRDGLWEPFKSVSEDCIEGVVW